MPISKLQPFLLGLIGNPVEHSRSPQIFSDFFSSEGYLHGQYSLFPLDHINEVTSLIHSQSNLIGFNVTIPFKSEIIPLLTHISPQANAIGAVNTVKITRSDDGFELFGHNTDYFGFEETLSLLPQKPKQAPKNQEAHRPYPQRKQQKSVMLPLFILEIGKKPGHGALEAQLGEDGKAQSDPQQQFPNPDEFGVEVARKEIKQVQCAQCHPYIGDQGGFEALAYDQSHGANLQQSNQVNR